MTATKLRDEMRDRHGLRLGRIKDVTADLAPEQRTWLGITASDLGCETVAEYLLELVRDEHARACQDD